MIEYKVRLITALVKLMEIYPSSKTNPPPDWIYQKIKEITDSIQIK